MKPNFPYPVVFRALTLFYYLQGVIIFAIMTTLTVMISFFATQPFRHHIYFLMPCRYFFGKIWLNAFLTFYFATMYLKNKLFRVHINKESFLLLTKRITCKNFANTVIFFVALKIFQNIEHPHIIMLNLIQFFLLLDGVFI